MQRNVARLRTILLIVCGAVAILSSIVSPIVEGGVALPFAVRVLIAVLVIAPVGFAMGMPFPTGLSLLERLMPESVRWAWAMNAASSVMGSAAAMFFAIYIGLRMTLILGAVCYALAWLFVRISMLSRSASVPAPVQ